MIRWPIRPQTPFMPIIVFMVGLGTSHLPSGTLNSQLHSPNSTTFVPVPLAIWPFARFRPADGTYSRIYFNSLDYLIQIVWHLHGAVGEGRAAHAALAQDFVEDFLIGAVIRNRGGRILELMASEDTDDALTRLNNSFLVKFSRPCHAGCRRRLTPQPPCPDLGLGV